MEHFFIFMLLSSVKVTLQEPARDNIQLLIAYSANILVTVLIIANGMLGCVLFKLG